MATVHDVAAYILQKQGGMSAMKLQKLVYYAQAWTLAWLDRPLFAERIEAWANGPVVPALWPHHRGKFAVTPPWPLGSPEALTADEKGAIDRVLDFYGDKSPQWLSDLTHMERPWREARGNLSEDTPSGAVIAVELMADYYSNLPAKS